MEGKTLHRIYFGFDGKPDIFQAYRKTWQTQLPEYTIRDWDASNLPMDLNSYTRELYDAKDHAFLTDYFRWWVLREHGGIYLDADVEIFNGTIFDELISELYAQDEYHSIIGIDERQGGWYTAHSMACKRDSPLAKFMCTVYEDMGPIRAWRKKAFYLWAPQLTALYFFTMGHNIPGMGTSPNLTAPAVVGGVKILPQEWFSPVAPTGKPEQPFLLNAVSENTCLCHHFGCSWHDSDSIYLSHAKEKGGQSGVMLQDLISAHTASSPMSVKQRLRLAIRRIKFR